MKKKFHNSFKIINTKIIFLLFLGIFLISGFLHSIIDKVILYTINGLSLKTYNINQIKQGVDISTLAQGVYIVKMIDQVGNQVAVQKIIK